MRVTDLELVTSSEKPSTVAVTVTVLVRMASSQIVALGMLTVRVVVQGRPFWMTIPPSQVLAGGAGGASGALVGLWYRPKLVYSSLMVTAVRVRSVASTVMV